MTIQTISPLALYDIINDDPETLVIDVRTPEEFLEGHIVGAKLLPLSHFASIEATISRLNELRETSEQPIYVTCASGRRAMQACEQLKDSQFHNLYIVEGGTKAWIENGLPVDDQ